MLNWYPKKKSKRQENLFLQEHALRKGHVNKEQNGSHCKPGKEPNLLAPWGLGFPVSTRKIDVV